MTTATTAPPALLTVQEAADFLRVSTRTLYTLTRPRGPIPCVRVGPRGVRYTLAALQRFIDQQQNGDGDCTVSRSAPSGERKINGKKG